MNPEAWQAEIEQLKAQIKPLEDRIRMLRSALRGPRVEVEIIWHDHYTYHDDCTLAAAFQRDDDLYGSPTKVSVGGAEITSEQWRFDLRNPYYRENVDWVHGHALKENAERDRQAGVRRAQADTVAAPFSGQDRVGPWVPYVRGWAETYPGWSGEVTHIGYRRGGEDAGMSPFSGMVVGESFAVRIPFSGLAIGHRAH